MGYTRFEDLPVWKDAIQLADRAFKLCDDRSFNYQGDLRIQLTRAGLSIPNNIAEGFEWRSTKALLHSLKLARGSAGEFRSMLYVIGLNERYGHLEEKRSDLMDRANSIGRQLNRWMESLRRAAGAAEHS